jgi:hypothetical protein
MVLKKGFKNVLKRKGFKNGITLLATVRNIFNRIILERIIEPLEKKIRIEQAGFRPN